MKGRKVSKEISKKCEMLSRLGEDYLQEIAERNQIKIRFSQLEEHWEDFAKVLSEIRLDDERGSGMRAAIVFFLMKVHEKLSSSQSKLQENSLPFLKTFAKSAGISFDSKWVQNTFPICCIL